jgi:tetratricopeptide (TPR) repeat protein
MMSHLRSTATLKHLAVVMVSLILALWHFGPLGGTLPALIITIGIQVYLLGYWAARAIGLWRRSETVVIRVIWMAACGLAITIVSGAVCRLLLVPLVVYVIGIHVVMFGLSMLPAEVRPIKPITRQAIPFYGLLAIICVLFVLVGWERNKLRFADYPDQTYPVSLADWWINHPQPEQLVSRNAAEASSLTYWSSDGLTYLFAVWGWSSGASAVQVIWYTLTPLFVWLVPLAHFAVVYRVTKRVDSAAWATGIVFIFALMTLNTPSVLGGAWMYGQEAAFHLTTLRYFSTALLLPMTLFAFFSSLRAPQMRHYMMTGMLILALALTHPRQFLVIFTALYGILGLRWLMQPSKRKLRRTVALGLSLLPAFAVPLWQFSSHLQTQITPDLIPDLAGAASISQQVIEPSMLLFHPFVILALMLSVVAVIRLRRSLAAQYVVATVVIMLVLSYVPPIFNMISRVMGSYYGIHFVFELFYIFPIGLILGIAISYGHEWITTRMRLRGMISNVVVTACFVVAGLVLLIEPFPIVRSARDQIEALNEMQAIRDIRPFEEVLLARLSSLPITGKRVVYLTSNRIANFVIEGVPNAIVTGGRNQNNAAYAGSSRFFDAQHAPLLDDQDVAFLKQYDVSYIVLNADNSRIPQLKLQPERFEWMGATAGYAIFGVRKPIVESPVDAIFAAMNAQYGADATPRWDASGYHLERQSSGADWQDVIKRWQQAPENDISRYGLLVSRLMSGDNSQDDWQAFSRAQPELFGLVDAYAHVLAQQGNVQGAVDLLFNTFEQAQDDIQVLAARSLMSEPFFGRLTSQQVDKLIAAADTDAWANLMDWNHEPELRERVALLMSAGRWETAAAWLGRIPEVRRAPQDLVAEAAIHLLAGNLEAARATLKPSISIDWIEPHLSIYENDWSDAGNSAARMYFALTEPAGDEISPTVISQTGSLFLMQAEAVAQDKTLITSATVGDYLPALSPNKVLVEVVSANGVTSYGQSTLDVTLQAGIVQRITIPVELTGTLPTQTKVSVRIQLMRGDDLIYQTVEFETTLP